ncbi:MAG TPA: polysaccharide pyruvyl transferase family protein [Bryobacteraceae bacterium]|nr:polysaccharide pyruvyl transferase family protein [Bryobacteraceae bacterium]
MIATELALVGLASRHGWARNLETYQPLLLSDRLMHLSPSERAVIENRCDIGLCHRSAINDYTRLISADLILFWGDFLHMAQYFRAMSDILADFTSSHQRSVNGPALAARVLLLHDADDETLARRTMTFGTTLLFNNLHDEFEDVYHLPATRLLSLARRVWVRDALSAAKVAHLRKDYATSYFGVDCTLLLDPNESIYCSKKHQVSTENILVFLGRDPSLHGPLLSVAESLAAALRLPLRWLPWGERSAFPHFSVPAAPLSCTADATTQDLLQHLRNSSAVVTDTYHMAVLAWNFGVPAVTGFSAYGAASTDVSSGAAFNWRDKREIFYSQYDALDFLIRPEELFDNVLLQKRVNRLLEMLKDGRLVSSIVSRIHTHAAELERSLAEEISLVLRN